MVEKRMHIVFNGITYEPKIRFRVKDWKSSYRWFSFASITPLKRNGRTKLIQTERLILLQSRKSINGTLGLSKELMEQA